MSIKTKVHIFCDACGRDFDTIPKTIYHPRVPMSSYKYKGFEFEEGHLCRDCYEKATILILAGVVDFVKPWSEGHDPVEYDNE